MAERFLFLRTIHRSNVSLFCTADWDWAPCRHRKPRARLSKAREARVDGGPQQHDTQGACVRIDAESLPCTITLLMSFEENNSVLAPPGTATSILAVMVAALFSIAILDVGPLLGISDDANAILTLLAAGIFVIAHGYVALGWRNILAFSLITAARKRIGQRKNGRSAV
jgi:hypothetical protein